MLILIVFIVGLILLLMPLLHPLAVLLQQFFTIFVSGGIRAYSHLTLRNNRRKTLNMQLSLLFGYTLILFIDTIASSQSAMLLINLKYYYGSIFTIIPSQNTVSEVESFISQCQADPVINHLQFSWLSKPLDTQPTLYTLGRVQNQDLRL